jgi:hypothetical protein
LEMDFCQINSPPSGTTACPHRRPAGNLLVYTAGV